MYEFGDGQIIDQKVEREVIEKEEIEVREIMKKSDYQVPKLRGGNLGSKDNDSYKYNLFSCIDEGVNNIVEKNPAGCTFPGNECIASRNFPQSLGWLN